MTAEYDYPRGTGAVGAIRAGASCACCAPRRGFLGRLAALGAAAMIPGADAIGQAAGPAGAAAARRHRIDIHHHILPPDYMKEAVERRLGAGMRPWSPAKSLEDMDASGIATSIVSLIQPGVWFNDLAAGRRLSRDANEYGAKMAVDYPGRFGLFATLPLPDTEGSLREIEYSLDVLKADGIGLMTSYGDKWLGDGAFAPVWEELNRRRAVVYTHPLTPQCCRNLVKDVAPGTIEYTADTTRTIANLLFSGTAARFPDIRWIFSHGGGTMPFLLSRFTRQEADLKDRARERLPRGVMYELKKFHYDVAQANHAGALAALLKIIPVSQVLYGTDFPFRDGAEVNGGLRAHRFPAKHLRAIERDNALRLLPRISA